MAYVPQFAHDVFLSYARADDEALPLPGPAVAKLSPWVTDLQTWITASLRTLPGLSVHWDRTAERDAGSVPEALRTAVVKSAILVVVLSPNWLLSPWCRGELAAFVEAAGTNALRALVVELDEIVPAEWPQRLQGPERIQMWTRNAQAAGTIPLGRLPESAAEYVARMTGLVNQVRRWLRTLRDATGTEPIAAPSGPSIYVGETFAELDQAEIRGALDRDGWIVRPKATLRQVAGDPTTAITAAMEGADAYLQILGPEPALATNGSSWESLQLAALRSLGDRAPKQVCLWSSRETHASVRARAGDAKRDAAHATLFDDPRLVVLGREELKSRLADLRRALVTPRPVAPAKKTDDLVESPYVWFAAARGDEEITGRMSDACVEKGLGYDVVEDLETSLKRTQVAGLGVAAPTGVVVVCNQGDDAWYRRQAERMRTYYMESKRADGGHAGLGVALRDQRRPPVHFAFFDRWKADDLGGFSTFVRQRLGLA